MTQVHSYIVLETDIENGDIEAARDRIAEASLGAMVHGASSVHESISLEPGNLQMRIPLPEKFFEWALNSPLVEFYYNDGPICPTCNRPNEDQRNVNPQVHSESRSHDGGDG